MKRDKQFSGLPPAQRRNAKYFNLIFPVVLILGLSIFAWVSRSSDMGFSWSAEAVSITDPTGAVYTIQFAEVTSITLEDCPGFGRCLSGESGASWVYGVWENDAWGTYRLFSAPDAGRCIVFQLGQTRCVLSYESDKTTEALYEQLVPIVAAAREPDSPQFPAEET